MKDINRSIFYILIFSLSWNIWANNAKSEPKNGFSVAGIPAISFDPDQGFGGGIFASVSQDQDNIRPYKMAIDAQVFLTSKGFQSHFVRFDRLELFHLPLRFIGRLGFYSTISQNFCGKASDATCDEGEAVKAASQLALKGEARDEFLWRYFRNPFMSISGSSFVRYKLVQWETSKLELMGSYRGTYYMNRDFKKAGPYPNSLFEKEFGGSFSDGFLSLLEVGLMVDGRDNEASPTKGHWLEGSVRGAFSIIGSKWDLLGGNVSARFYIPIDEARRVVLATQSIVDAIGGEVPYDVASKIGGSLSQSDYSAIGGQYIGRGIREQRFVGKLKGIQQAELRYKFWSFPLFSQAFDLMAVGLLDLGVAAWDASRFLKDIKHLHMGFGGGLRLIWNKNFVIRTDVAFSPEENYAPGIYIKVGNVF